jgi:MerR family transcriptional regulator, repressor of the yfmOP operon
MTEQEQFTKILTLLETNNSRLDKLDTDIRATNQRLEDTNKRLQEEAQETKKQFQKWDERYLNLVKEQGQTARTIIIAAASVVILSPVLGAVAELVKHFFIG